MFSFHVTWFSFIMNCLSGETPGEGFPSFRLRRKFTLANQQEPTHHACKTGMAYAKNLPLASFLNAAAPSADGDHGFHPWTPVPFFEKKGTQKA